MSEISYKMIKNEYKYNYSSDIISHKELVVKQQSAKEKRYEKKL